MIIGDLEANGLLNEATKIWCATFYDTETDKYLTYQPSTLEGYLEPVTLAGLITEYLDFLVDACENPAVSFHNGVCYDIPLLEKLVRGWKFKGRLFDTLYASRILWPDRLGGHGLASWGEEFGISKPIHEDWSQFSEEMLHRNKEDVRIATQLSQKIIEYVTELNIRDSRITNNTFSNNLRFEQEVAQIIEEQANNGWLFDLEKAYRLEEELHNNMLNIEEELLPKLPIRLIRPTEVVTKAFKANGDMTELALRWYTQNNLKGDIGGDFSKVQFEKMNLNSDSQVKNYLLDNGWKPHNWNFKKDRFNKNEKDDRGRAIRTTPKMPKEVEEWEEIAEQLHNPSIKLMAEYNKASHRYSQVKGLINNVRPHDHRIPAEANTCGTNTARMQHRKVVNIPKSDPKVYYGKEMRSLFVCPESRVIVGIDASALEARVEAHYIYPYDPDGAKELIEGDIHAKNAEIFSVSRGLAKNGKYALTYGCSERKLASTLAKPQSEAGLLYSSFWEGNPGLKELKERLENSYERFGHILAIDGRPLTIRYEHALINTLFQSAGSIIMKKALILLVNKLEECYDKSHWMLLGNFHDEMQLEVNPELAENIGNIGISCIKQAAEFFNMNVPFTGEFKIGKNWASTH